MPSLTDDRKESIWKTYHMHQSYTITADIESVDPRTVRNIVKEKKAKLATDELTNSIASKPTKSSNDSLTTAQLKAYKMFHNDQPNELVCLKLKLPPRKVIKFRTDFNQMKKSNLDETLVKLLKETADLSEIIEQRRNENLGLEQKQNGLLSELKELTSVINSLTKEKDRLERSIPSLRQSERIAHNEEQEATSRLRAVENELIEKSASDVVGLVRQLEMFPDSVIFQDIKPLLDSSLFQKIAPAFLHMVFQAIIHQPNRTNIIAAFQSLPPEYYGHDIKLPCEELLDREEFSGLLEYLEEHGPSDGNYWLTIMAVRSMSPNPKVKYGALKVLRDEFMMGGAKRIT